MIPFRLLFVGFLVVWAGAATAQESPIEYDYSESGFPSNEAENAPPSLPSTISSPPTRPLPPTRPSPATPPSLSTTPRSLTLGFPVENDVTPDDLSESAVRATPSPTPGTPAIETAAPAPTPGPSPTPLPPLSKAVENLRWEASLAENSYAIGKSDQSKLALLVAYERVIGPLCMPGLHRTLTYDGKPGDPRCLEYLGKIEALDPSNAMAICAREGIDAKSCRAAFAGQRVEIFIPGRTTTSPNTNAGAAELEEKLSTSSIEPQLKVLADRIYTLEYQSRGTTTPNSAEKENLTKLLNEALGLACRLTKLELKDPPSRPGERPRDTSPSPAATPTSAPLFPGLATGPKKKNPFDEVLEQFGGTAAPRETTVAPAGGRIRVRKITDRCRSFIDRALKVDRTMAMPICYREGFYTPACVDARRKSGTPARPVAGTNAQPTSDTSAGFSKF